MNMSYVMETEINSQGQVIDNLTTKYIVNYCVLMDIPLQVNQIVIIASGSSYNAAMYGKNFFEGISKVQTSVEYASEVANNDFYNFREDVLYVFLSQSGNSADTVAAIKKVKNANAQTLSITNNKESTLFELSDYKFDIETGREFAIAATKTFSATVLMLWLIALKVAQNKQIDISEETKNVYSVKHNIEAVLNNIDNIDLAVKFLAKQKDFSICGFNTNYALTREAALKIKETCYINTSFYPMGEFIHGHFALLNKSNVLLTFALNELSDFEKEILEKIQQTYRPKIVLISDEYDDYNCDILVKFPKGQSRIANIINSIITVQMIALKMAIKLKRNVDKPKGLQKVVGK